MDRRTFLFILSFALALLFVNYFFDQQHQETVKEWQTQQLAKKNSRLKQLNDELNEKKDWHNEITLVTLTTNDESYYSSAIQIENSLLTVLSQLPAPKKLSVSKNGALVGDAVLNFSSDIDSGPALYSLNDESAKLSIGQLGDIGSFDLLAVTIPSNIAEQSVTLVGHYVNGVLSFPLQEKVKLEEELSEQRQAERQAPYPDETANRALLRAFKDADNAIILVRSGTQFLPVALYSPKTEALSLLASYEKFPHELVTESGDTVSKKVEERFYVLQNRYQQLVFSNYGAALAEINLPFVSENDNSSVVKEVEADRLMVQDYPYNARFPSHPYYTPSENGKEPQRHEVGSLGGYYPLLRRDLIEGGKRPNYRIPPRLYALNLVSEYPEFAELVYEVKSFDKDKIVFEAKQPQRRITKTYRLNSEEAPYTFDLSIKVEGDARGIWLTSGVPEAEWAFATSSGAAQAMSLKYSYTKNQKLEVEQLSAPKDSITISSVIPDWICNSNGFFGIIMDPLTQIDSGFRAQLIPGSLAPSRLVEIDEEYNRFPSQDLPGYLMLLPLNSSGGTMNFRLFAGPFAESVLNSVDTFYTDSATGYNPQYIACKSFHGWFAFISEPFAKFLFLLMNLFHSLTGSWALSIFLLTVALRIMLYPLNAWSTRSMLKMQQISPQVAAIQEKYKKDPKKAQMEVMNLYRENKVNPVSGCFPLLIQLPFLIGMFDLLKSSFALRGASFIPGWIDDLTAPDVLFSWNMPIFFIGNQFHLLPILLGITMFLQQRLMSTMPKDQSQWTDQQRQQRAMGSIMTVVFTLMFYHFPSGLNIYWLSSMLLGMVQQWWMQRQTKSNPVTPSTATTRSASK